MTLKLAVSRSRAPVPYGANLFPAVVCVQSGLTPLHIGAFMGHADVVSELLRQRCDVSAVTSRGETALHYAVRCGQPYVTKLVLDATAADKIDATTFDVSDLTLMILIRC